MDFFQIRVSNHGRIRAKKDTRAKERAVNAITDELVYTACCRLVNYYNCEVPAIFRLALVHQRYTYTDLPTLSSDSQLGKPTSNKSYKNQILNAVVRKSHIALMLTFNFVKFDKYIKKITSYSTIET